MPDTRASGWPLEAPAVGNPATFPEVVDRDVEHPTRVSVNPVATSPAPFVADLGDEGGDGEAGTPIDAALFAGVRTYVDAGDVAARDEAVSRASADATSKDEAVRGWVRDTAKAASAKTADTLSQTLPVEMGGTGRATAGEAATALIGGLDVGAGKAITDDVRFVTQDSGDGDPTCRLREASDVWEWAEPKVSELVSAGDEALSDRIDSIVERGTDALSPDSVDSIVGGTPASEVGDAGFAEKLAVERLWQSVEAKVEEARKAVLLAAHPVGSYYWSAEATDPSELFGGEWEQVKDVFVWAKGDGDEVGATGGARTVALTTAQMPAHTHTGPSHSHSVAKNAVSIAPTRTNAATSTGGSLLGIGGSGNATNYPSGYSMNGFAGGSNSNFYGAAKGPVGATNDKAFNTDNSGTGATGSTGSGTAHENMPPYVAAHCWHRTD